MQVVENQNRKLKEKPQIVVDMPRQVWRLIRNEDYYLLKVHVIRYVNLRRLCINYFVINHKFAIKLIVQLLQEN